jgi:adenylate cyclase
MVAGGIPESKKDHAESVAEFAIELLEKCSTFMIGTNPINVRIGIHSGPVIAGVIGKSKLAYDVKFFIENTNF